MTTISSFKEQNIALLDRTSLWVYEHPLATKVAEIGGLVLGVGVFASTYPLSGVGFFAGAALSGVLTTASAAALFALDLFAPPHHDMRTHVYQPGECEGGKLYYEGDVPILSLDSDDPYKAGSAHGYLAGEAIHRLTKRFSLVLHTLAGRPRAEALPKTLAKIRETVPPEYLREMEGLVEGYNRWAGEQYWWTFPKKMTLDDALLFHLMPDSLHFHPDEFEKTAEERAVACSAVVDRDPQDGFVFARNMDWPSFGLAGAYSLVIERRHANGLCSTAEVGVPGFVGTLTGMNDRGLSLAMNVCAGYEAEVAGMPAAFYNRACLERCGSVKEVEGFVSANAPLGPYHMTVADRERAESIHFYQSPGGSHVIRRWEKNEPLVTLNCRYNPQPCNAMHYSRERQGMIDEFFQRRNGESLEAVLSLPFVNNWLTTHRVVMKPETGAFAVAFDNAFAGNAPLQPVTLFQRAVR